MAEKKTKDKPKPKAKAKKKAPAKAKAVPSTRAIHETEISADLVVSIIPKRCATCGHGVSKMRGETHIVECHRYPQNPIQGYPAMDPKADWCGEWCDNSEWTVEAPAE